MSAIEANPATNIRLEFDRSLDCKEQGRLLQLFADLRSEDPVVIPPELTDRFQHWNQNFLETEISFATSDPSGAEIKMALAAPNTFWREALSVLVKWIERELGANVKVRPTMASVSS